MKYWYTLALLWVSGMSQAQVSNLNRSNDPIVITGAALPTFAGGAPGSIVAFRFSGGAWQQIPVQVDERASLDIVKPYGPLATGSGYPPSPNNVRVLFYTDPGTLTGADPVATFDADDELVFMAADAGGRATGGTAAGTVPGTGREVFIVDPLGGQAYAYLFQNAGALPQSGGQGYLNYGSNLFGTAGFPVNANGTNAENTTISTAKYSWHFSSEWVSDELQLGRNGTVDILDRHKNFFANGSCIRHEDAFSAAENAFVTVKEGPVRVIRSYMGAVSGPLTQRTHLFYEGRHDILTDLRVHSIPSIQDAFDYSNAARGMMYRNNLNPAGVTIDGTPDAVTLGNVLWEQVSGSAGVLSILHRRSTTLTPADATFTSYYDDNSTAPASNCTGDGQALGTSGVSVQFLANVCTDPMAASGCGATSPNFRTLQTSRILYADPASAPVTTAATYEQQFNNPLQISSAAWPTATATINSRNAPSISVYPNPGEGSVTVVASRSYLLQVFNPLGQLVQTAQVLPGTSQVVINAKGILTIVFSNEKERQILRQVMQ